MNNKRARVLWSKCISSTKLVHYAIALIAFPFLCLSYSAHSASITAAPGGGDIITVPATSFPPCSASGTFEDIKGPLLSCLNSRPFPYNISPKNFRNLREIFSYSSGVTTQLLVDYDVYNADGSFNQSVYNVGMVSSRGGCPVGYTLNSGSGLCELADGQDDPGKQCGDPEHCAGNPCNVATGNKYQVEVDYAGVGFAALSFVRYYNSSDAAPHGSLGEHWRSNWDSSIRRADAGSTSTAYVLRGNGKILVFNLSGSNWVSQSDVAYTLTKFTDTDSIDKWKLITPEDNVEIYRVDNGHLKSITSRNGTTLYTLTYYSAGAVEGQLSTVSNTNGLTLQFTYDADDHLATMVDPAGKTFTYSYVSNKLLQYVIYPDDTVSTTDNPRRQYIYDESVNTSSADLPNALTGIVDENGVRFATFQYQTDGRAITTKHALDADKVTLIYVNATTTYVKSYVSATVSATRSYAFDVKNAVKHATSITADPCPECGPYMISLNSDGYPSYTLDLNANRTNYTYDSTRRDLETTRVEGLNSSGSTVSGVTRTISTSWNSSFRLPDSITEKDSSGTILRTTTFTYDTGGLGELIQKTITDNLTSATRSWTYGYTDHGQSNTGQITSITAPTVNVSSPLSNITYFDYYSTTDSCTGMTSAGGNGCRSQLKEILDAAGHRIDFTDYNAHGQPLTIYDYNNQLTTNLTYDARLRLKSKEVGGELTQYTYNNVGQLTLIHPPDGADIGYVYDDAHRLTKITDHAGNAIVYTLDLKGNRIAEKICAYTDPTCATPLQSKTRNYNYINQLYQEIGALGETTTYFYDALGNVHEKDRPLTGDSTCYLYDGLNRLFIKIENAASPCSAGAQTSYTLNALDQLTAITDPRGNVTSYSINALGDIGAIVSPDAGAKSNNNFDAAGNVMLSQDGFQSASRQITYDYDALNRVKHISYNSDSTLNTTLTYDTVTSSNKGQGKLTNISENGGALTTDYAYDVQGRLTSETVTFTAISPFVTGYHYTNGLLDQITYPDGRIVNYSFDGDGRINAIDVTKGSVTSHIVSSVIYQPFGPVKSFVYGGSGSSQTYTRSFDTNGRIASFNLGNQVLYSCFDNANRITQFRSSPGSCGSSGYIYQYAYNLLDRLTDFTSTAATQSFSYDSAGNRTNAYIGSVHDVYNVPSSNNQITSISGGHTLGYSFDQNGSTYADGINTYSYNARNRMKQSVSSITTNYTFDATGRRVRKSNINGDVIYLYDGMGHLIEEYSASGTFLKAYIYLNDMPVAVIQ